MGLVGLGPLITSGAKTTLVQSTAAALISSLERPSAPIALGPSILAKYWVSMMHVPLIDTPDLCRRLYSELGIPLLGIKA